jgi:hypothetical protein
VLTPAADAADACKALHAERHQVLGSVTGPSLCSAPLPWPHLGRPHGRKVVATEYSSSYAATDSRCEGTQSAREGARL